MPLHPRLVLKKIEEEMKNKRSLNTLRTILSENLTFKTKEIRKFSYKIDGHSWKGFILTKRNNIYGTIFSFFDNKFMIIRGYPKILYASNSGIVDKESVVENKWDGTNLGIWLFPNGKLMGKTRAMERFDLGGWKGRKWNQLFYQAIGNNIKELRNLLKDDYQVFGELCGTLNEGDFIKYDFPIKYLAFDIVDRRTLGFLPYEKKVKLFSSYGLEYVGLYWKGTLTLKSVERIEFELKNKAKELEGCVAKAYDQRNQDLYFAKLKCEEIKDKAWKGTKKFTIPSNIIKKAIRKASEQIEIFSTKKELEEFILEELREEATEELISSSKQKIKRLMFEFFTPQSSEKEIIKYLKELEKEGKEMENKGIIMRILSKKFLGYNPSMLFRSYSKFLSKRKIKNGEGK